MKFFRRLLVAKKFYQKKRFINRLNSRILRIFLNFAFWIFRFEFCVGNWKWKTDADGWRPRKFKSWETISKSNSQGVGQKFWYPLNQHDSLNEFHFLEDKIAHERNLCRFLIPEFSLSMGSSLPVNGQKWRSFNDLRKPSFTEFSLTKIESLSWGYSS